MGDPRTSDLSSWLFEIVGSFLVAAGIGGATMFAKSKAKIDGRLDCLEEGHSAQATQLEVLKTCQENTRDWLKDIKESTEKTNEKIDVLMEAALNRLPGGKRRTDA
jgi:hypothetical protein